MIQKVALSLLQLIFILITAPFLTGIIKKAKAFLQNRKGPVVFQFYRDLYKYMQKETVISQHTSWIFQITPYIYFSSLIVAALMIPAISTNGFFNFTGDIILIIYLFAVGRFFLTLSGLDAGSAFGGMASSREMAISSVAEPATMLPLFTMALASGTTNMTGMVSKVVSSGTVAITPAHLMSFVALFIVAIAETGRIPVDNPDTHLELTMIHEGMLLEYSGKPLALLHLSASLKQILFYAILVNLFFPWGIAVNLTVPAIITAMVIFLAKVIILGFVMAVLETSLAKMKLFKVPELLMGSFLLGLLGLITRFFLGGN